MTPPVAHAGHGHAPGAGSSAAAHQRALTVALALTGTYMLVEFVAGFVTGSLALLSDATHMATDVMGLALALGAIRLALRVQATQHTYGLYRLEVLAAVVNGLVLFAVGGWVLVEAARRLLEPPEVAGTAVVVVAALGFAVNFLAYRLLRAGADASLNVRGAFLEVAMDMLGSLGVVLAGVIQVTTGWDFADPLIAGLIGLLILPRTYRLMRQAARILMEAAPEGIDVAAAHAALAGLPDVADVHHLHIWTVTDGIESASAHIVVSRDESWRDVLDSARAVLSGFGVTHATIQVEPQGHDDPDMPSCGLVGQLLP